MKYNFRLNNIMLALTFVTIVFMPPAIIGGIFGMNVVLPGQVTDEDDPDADSLVPFYIVLSSIFVMMIIFGGVYKFLVSRDQAV